MPQWFRASRQTTQVIPPPFPTQHPIFDRRPYIEDEFIPGDFISTGDDERARVSLWMRFTGPQRRDQNEDPAVNERRRRFMSSPLRSILGFDGSAGGIDEDEEFDETGTILERRGWRRVVPRARLGNAEGENGGNDGEEEGRARVTWDDNVGGSEESERTTACPMPVEEYEGLDDGGAGGANGVNSYNSPRRVIAAASASDSGSMSLASGVSRVMVNGNAGRSSRQVRFTNPDSSSDPPSTSTTVGGSSGAATGSLTTRSSSNISGDANGTASVTRHHYHPSMSQYRPGYQNFSPLGSPETRMMHVPDLGYHQGTEGMGNWEDADFTQRPYRRGLNTGWDQGAMRWEAMSPGGAGEWNRRQGPNIVGVGMGLIGRRPDLGLIGAGGVLSDDAVAAAGGYGLREYGPRDFGEVHRGFLEAERTRQRRRRRDWWRRVWKWMSVRNRADRSEGTSRRSRRRRWRSLDSLDSDGMDAMEPTYEDLIELEERNVKRGLTRDEIEMLEVFRMKEEQEREAEMEKDVKVDDECRICLQKIGSDDELIKLPCMHFYHRSCIRRWFQTNRTCPVCRKEVERKTSLKP